MSPCFQDPDRWRLGHRGSKITKSKPSRKVERKKKKDLSKLEEDREAKDYGKYSKEIVMWKRRAFWLLVGENVRQSAVLTQPYDWRGYGCTRHFQHISAPVSTCLKGSDSGGSNCSLGCDLPLAQLISRALPLWISSLGSQLIRCCANTHRSLTSFPRNCY